jgi:protein TonB
MYKSLLLLIAATLLCASLNAQTSSGSEVPTKPLRVSWGVVAGNAISEVQPKYPDPAKQNHIFGDVLLAIHIDKEGTVTDVKSLRGNPIFASAAKEALQQWKFRPYRLNGTLVELDTQIVCAFDEKTPKDPLTLCHAELK